MAIIRRCDEFFHESWNYFFYGISMAKAKPLYVVVLPILPEQMKKYCFTEFDNAKMFFPKTMKTW